MAEILTIDDSATMRQLLSSTLEGAGHQVREARDGREGLVAALESAAGLVITDLNMPGMDGLAVVEALRGLEAYRWTPILVLTTVVDWETRKKARVAGATGWINKPFDPSKLLAAIRKVVG